MTVKKTPSSRGSAMGRARYAGQKDKASYKEGMGNRSSGPQEKKDKVKTEKPQRSQSRTVVDHAQPHPKAASHSGVVLTGHQAALSKKRSTSDSKTSSHDGERIAKYIARAGVCSRRDAERMIAEGRVKVDGRVLESPALNVTMGQIVLVDNRPIAAREEPRLWRLHKPNGTITTNRDPQGRRTVFDLLPVGMPRTVTIGRLDFTTEGLLLLTNDGELARYLELPRHGWVRRYRVRVHGRVDEKRLKLLENGVTIDGVTYEPMTVTIDETIADEQRTGGANTWLSVSIREGKNREVRRVMDYLGLDVTRLIRVSFGPFQLGKLPKGFIEEVPRRALHEQLSAFFSTDDGASQPKPSRKTTRDE